MYDILVIGRLTSCDIIFSGMKKLPEPGEEEFCNDFFIKAGGSANVAIGLAKLGVNTGFLTEIGIDILGELVYNLIIENGVKHDEILRPKDYRTCVSAVLSTTKDRGFATFWDESNSLITNEVVSSRIKTAPYVITDIVHCMKSQISEIAWENNTKLIIDSVWNKEMKLNKIKHILRKTEIFTANEIEATIITGEENPIKALSILSDYSKKTVIKLGSDGCIASSEGVFSKVPAVDKFEPVDTTGAGDLFLAGLVYGYLNGWTFDKCLELGNVTGGLGVTFFGGTDNIFNYENVMFHFNKKGSGLNNE